MKKVLLFVLVIACYITTRAQDAQKPLLGLGDPAPSLAIAKWLKGDSIGSLNDSKVSVVEFWATWCGPCILGMPHLSQLAKQYPAVSFIGVDASEHTDNMPKVKQFVEVAKDMMAYNVAYATPKGPMSTNWLHATGQRGIPVAFVIDKKGRIGWMGHPLMGLSEALALATQNKLTVDAAQAINKKWQANQVEGKSIDAELKTALKGNKVDEALKLNDQLLERWPFMIAIASGKKYALLTAKNPKAAREFGEYLLKHESNAPVLLKSVAQTIFYGSDARVLGEIKVKITGMPDLDLAKKLINQALTCSEEDPETTEMLKKIKALEATDGTR
ncbi:TlpA family protein disulfide reductase [Pedobacter sp. MW01-1-1]|uniref:TlpA family protein disulfide reductase n=1 Tax=Pedobacter sp. MW01-1-1 TaxID=3383027 RepID=UPI003FEECF16